jgi:GntR family transcriptional regulator, phosphonate transport system regulatory protein
MTEERAVGTRSKGVDRTSGVALWRQIADDIRGAIGAGEFRDKGKLPGELALAERFGVNRHTVRAAIAALQNEGIVKAMPGRGTEILGDIRLSMPIARRTRFSTGLGGQARRPESVFVASAESQASGEVATVLKIPPGAPCIMLETLGLADGIPVSFALHYFPAARFAGMDEHFRRERSITRAFAALGLPDYVRVSTDISARHADEREREWLRLTPGSIVLEAVAINADLAGTPVQYSQTRFAAGRVSLHVESDVKD